ncbi:LytR family transcriptional regulator, partial [Priestia megaterium]
GKGEKIDGIYYYAVSDAAREALSSKLKQHLNID